MTKSFSASVKNWSDKAIRNADLIVRQSIQDVGREMTQPKDGLMRGAPFEEGVVPVDEGELINSSFVDVAGVQKVRGGGEQPPDFTAALAGFKAGDFTVIGFTAPHARPVEYGQGGVPGRFFVRNAVQQWNGIVQRNAARLKD